MTPEKTGQHISIQERTVQHMATQFSNGDISDVSLKDYQSEKSYVSLDEQQERRQTEKKWKFMIDSCRHNCRHHCRHGGSNNQERDCSPCDYFSDPSVSKCNFKPRRRSKKGRSKRYSAKGISPNYSSDFETLSIPKTCCRVHVDHHRHHSEDMKSRNKLCSVCHTNSLTKIDSHKNDKIDQLTTEINTDVIKITTTKDEINNDHDHYPVSNSPGKRPLSSPPSRSDSVQSPSSTSTSDSKFLSVSTPDLSDAEAVFIGSSSSESEKKRSTNNTCCRPTSRMSDQISDAPFLKIALALEKYLER